MRACFRDVEDSNSVVITRLHLSSNQPLHVCSQQLTKNALTLIKPSGCALSQLLRPASPDNLFLAYVPLQEVRYSGIKSRRRTQAKSRQERTDIKAALQCCDWVSVIPEFRVWRGFLLCQTTYFPLSLLPSNPPRPFPLFSSNFLFLSWESLPRLAF